MHRIGFIGFGTIAEHGHLPALLSFPEIEVVAVADLSCERRKRARAVLPGAEIYDAPFDLLRHRDLTGIVICTPPNSHAVLIEAACRRGLQTVICEKPFVLSAAEYAQVRHARDRSGARVISVNNWMHAHLNRRVREVVSAGWIGDIKAVRLHTGRTQAARGSESWRPLWRIDPADAGGGILLDHGWHQLYLLNAWMRARPHTVACVTRTVDARHAPVEDEATLELSYPGGSGRLELRWTASERRNGGCIIGSTGRLDIHDDHVTVRSARGVRTLPFDDRLTRSSYHPEWFQAMLASTLLPVDGAEADRTFHEAGLLVDTIATSYRSARLGGVPCPIPPAGAGGLTGSKSRESARLCNQGQDIPA